MTDPIDIATPLTFAVFDEFGRGADDRVQMYATAHMLAERERCAAEITRLRDELAMACELKRAYAERAALAAKVPQPAAFDHDIGADRYTVHRGAFWWHVRIGDSTANVGKFYTRNEAEDMALKLLTAFRDGAFAQHRTAPGASPPAALAVPAVTADDFFTLLGHAAFLRSKGQSDMPAYFLGLAARIAPDAEHAAKARALAASPQPPQPGSATPDAQGRNASLSGGRRPSA